MDEFQARWVAPFYLAGLLGSDVNEFKAALAEVDPSVVDRLLSARGWRERIVGSWFAGLKGWTQFEDRIGELLLASEVTYAGAGHCFAMACFADDKSRQYLIEYLDIYLRQPEKEYDQLDAILALIWIDQKQGANNATQFLSPGGLWETFTADWNDTWDLDKFKMRFWRTMEYCQANFGAPRYAVIESVDQRED